MSGIEYLAQERCRARWRVAAGAVLCECGVAVACRGVSWVTMPNANANAGDEGEPVAMSSSRVDARM